MIDIDELRKRAEGRLSSNVSELGIPTAEHDTRRLVHELEVYKIELDMQNDELRCGQQKMALAVEKYSYLYDLTPVGYFTLSRSGTILAENQAGARILGVDRSSLSGKSFLHYIAAEGIVDFSRFLENVFKYRSKESSEIVILTVGNVQKNIQIEAVASSSREECHIALIDAIVSGDCAGDEIARNSSCASGDPNVQLLVLPVAENSSISITTSGLSSWFLDTDCSMLITPNGEKVPLSAQQNTILGLLFVNSGKTVPFSLLLSSLGHFDDKYGKRRLGTLLSRLRSKVLEIDPLSALPVRARHGIGYAFLESSLLHSS